MVWMVACPSGEVTKGAIKRQRLDNGDPIGLTRLEDNHVVAFHNQCPHAKGPLTAGKLHGDEIVCPWHFFRFNLATGQAVGTPASIMHLKTYRVDEKDGQILIEQ